MHKLLSVFGQTEFKELGFRVRISKGLCVTWEERTEARPFRQVVGIVCSDAGILMHIFRLQRGESRSSRTVWTSAIWYFEADLSGGMQKAIKNFEGNFYQ